jgi:hypothetical protein
LAPAAAPANPSPAPPTESIGGTATPNAFPFFAGTGSVAAPTIPAGATVGAEDDEDRPRPSSPSFAEADSDEGYDTLQEFEKVAFYQRNPRDNAYKLVSRGRLLIQREKPTGSGASHSCNRMLMRHGSGGLKVLVNMKIDRGADYKYSSFANKTGGKVGQIVFLGCNSATDGMLPFIIKAADSAARPLYELLLKLAEK